MTAQIQLGDMTVGVICKDIKNVHLSVHPPTGRVTIAAPAHMSLDTIRVFAITKLAWIRQQQAKLQEQEREAPREFLDRESHYVWGKRYLLKVIEIDQAPAIELKHSKMLLHVRPGTGQGKSQTIMDEWYRQQLRLAAIPLITKWETRLGVKVERLLIQRMKTKWGSCTPESGYVHLNTDLAKKPPECLEYIVVHEPAHLLASMHNERLTSLMDLYLPHWQLVRRQRNRLPVGHEDWDQ